MAIDSQDSQIAYLTASPEGEAQPNPVEPGGEPSTFDGPDVIIEDPLDFSGMPKRITGSEDPDEQDRLKADPDLPATAKTDQGEQKPLEDWQVQLAAAERTAAGRLNEVATLRGRLRDQDNSIEELRKLVLAQMERDDMVTPEEELAEDAGIYGEEVVTDPHMRYMRDKIAGLEEDFEARRQQDEHYRHQLTDQANQVQAARQGEAALMSALGMQEAAFAETNKQYDEAYKFGRQKKAEVLMARGYSQEQALGHINQSELALAQEQLTIGGNVPQQVWNEALAYGFQAQAAQARPAVNPQVEQVADIERIKAGLASQSVGSMAGSGAAGGDPEYMTSEEFFAKVPAGLRQQIFMNPDKFEEVAKFGRIRVDW